MSQPDTVEQRARDVLLKIRDAEARAGRAVGSVTLCAVTKTFPAEAILGALAAGITDVGENRVQEAQTKRPEAEGLDGRARALRWHLIGHLQSNKARKAVELFDVVQTIDSVELAERVDRIAGELGRTISALIQVDLGHEPTKTGATEDVVQALAERFNTFEHLRLEGLMTIPPFFDDLELVRPYFRRLREVRDRVNDSNRLVRPLVHLSMGMSHDYEIAVEEGATIIRVGTAIFGSRA